MYYTNPEGYTDNFGHLYYSLEFNGKVKLDYIRAAEYYYIKDVPKDIAAILYDKPRRLILAYKAGYAKYSVD